MIVTLEDDTVLKVKGIGDVPFMTPNRKNSTYISDVLYVPRLKVNLIYVAQVDK